MLTPSGFDGIFIEANPRSGGMNRYGGEYGSQKHQFARNIRHCLHQIAAVPLGRELLELIGKRNAGVGTKANGLQRSVTIQFRPADTEAHQGASAGAWNTAGKSRTKKRIGDTEFDFAGAGSRSTVQIHCKLGESDRIFTRLAGVHTPTWVALAHELIHAFHHLSGTAYSEELQARTPSNTFENVKREEMWTTGLGVYRDTRISENAIRRQVGLPERTYYSFPHDADLIDSQQSPWRAPRYWKCMCLAELTGH